MLKHLDEISHLSKQFDIPHEEILYTLINVEGVCFEPMIERIRFSFNHSTSSPDVFFSVQNSTRSPLSIDQNQLLMNGKKLGSITNLCEDQCKIFYTRKNDKVLCFNPNDRSGCLGCRFCYSPKSSYSHETIATEDIMAAFKIWMEQNNLSDLKNIEQVAIVTGCFKNEETVVSYLINLRKVLKQLYFRGEILYFGIIRKKINLNRLKEISPLNLCFTLECFENREKYIRKDKLISIDNFIEILKYSLECGFTTNFSYILGLDSSYSIQKYFPLLLSHINTFPIISLFQTDESRLKIRHEEAWNLDYYLSNRRTIEQLFLKTNLRPNTWSNHRSLWRLSFANEKLKYE
jgi:hypothetical protein